MIPLSVEMACLLGIQNKIQAVCTSGLVLAHVPEVPGTLYVNGCVHIVLIHSVSDIL